MENAYHNKKESGFISVIYWWGPSVLWMTVIFSLSSRHSVTVSPEYVWNFLFFKTLHLIEYAVLFLLNVRAVNRGRTNADRTNRYVWAFALTILYAVTDEFHQRFVPSREGRLRDVIIDAIGAGLIWYFLLKLLPKAPQKLRSLAKRLAIPC
jgi:VanZ family protein